jgi:hypothetical protein
MVELTLSPLSQDPLDCETANMYIVLTEAHICHLAKYTAKRSDIVVYGLNNMALQVESRRHWPQIGKEGLASDCILCREMVL